MIGIIIVIFIYSVLLVCVGYIRWNLEWFNEWLKKWFEKVREFSDKD